MTGEEAAVIVEKNTAEAIAEVKKQATILGQEVSKNDILIMYELGMGLARLLRLEDLGGRK